MTNALWQVPETVGHQQEIRDRDAMIARQKATIETLTEENRQQAIEIAKLELNPLKRKVDCLHDAFERSDQDIKARFEALEARMQQNEGRHHRQRSVDHTRDPATDTTYRVGKHAVYDELGLTFLAVRKFVNEQPVFLDPSLLPDEMPNAIMKFGEEHENWPQRSYSWWEYGVSVEKKTLVNSLSKIVIDRSAPTWTKDEPKHYADLSACRNSRPCMVKRDGELWLLPIHPALRGDATPRDIGYWITAKRPSTQEREALFRDASKDGSRVTSL